MSGRKLGLIIGGSTAGLIALLGLLVYVAASFGNASATAGVHTSDLGGVDETRGGLTSSDEPTDDLTTWVEFSDRNKRFTARFPTAPQVETLEAIRPTADTKDGRGRLHTTLHTSATATRLYQVAVIVRTRTWRTSDPMYDLRVRLHDVNSSLTFIAKELAATIVEPLDEDGMAILRDNEGNEIRIFVHDSVREYRFILLERRKPGVSSHMEYFVEHFTIAPEVLDPRLRQTLQIATPEVQGPITVNGVSKAIRFRAFNNIDEVEWAVETAIPHTISTTRGGQYCTVRFQPELAGTFPFRVIVTDSKDRTAEWERTLTVSKIPEGQAVYKWTVPYWTGEFWSSTETVVEDGVVELWYGHSTFQSLFADIPADVRNLLRNRWYHEQRERNSYTEFVSEKGYRIEGQRRNPQAGQRIQWQFRGTPNRFGSDRVVLVPYYRAEPYPSGQIELQVNVVPPPLHPDMIEHQTWGHNVAPVAPSPVGYFQHSMTFAPPPLFEQLVSSGVAALNLEYDPDTLPTGVSVDHDRSRLEMHGGGHNFRVALKGIYEESGSFDVQFRVRYRVAEVDYDQTIEFTHTITVAPIEGSDFPPRLSDGDISAGPHRVHLNAQGRVSGRAGQDLYGFGVSVPRDLQRMIAAGAATLELEYDPETLPPGTTVDHEESRLVLGPDDQNFYVVLNGKFEERGTFEIKLRVVYRIDFLEVEDTTDFIYTLTAT
jgi:hypothetical protein